MLNEERVILMTKMEVYEENEGKKNAQIGNYFRSDYISLYILRSVISGTIAFGILFALYLFYDFEVFMENIYEIDLLDFVRRVLIVYGGTIIVYGLISYRIYSYRYFKAKKSLKKYYANLKKLNSLYNNEQQ